MKADVELLTGVLRIYQAGHTRENQDPYVMSATVVWVDKHSVEIKGVVKPQASPRLMREAMCAAFCELGVRNVWWRRRRGDDTYMVCVDTATRRRKWAP